MFINLTKCILLYTLGIIILPIYTMKYKLGEFPNHLKYYDDYIERYRLQHQMTLKSWKFLTRFGNLESKTRDSYNNSWLGRIKWCLIRHPLNYYRHEILGADFKHIYVRHIKIFDLDIEYGHDITQLPEFRSLNMKLKWRIKFRLI